MKKTKTIVWMLVLAIVFLTAGGVLFGVGFAQVMGETPEGEMPPIFSDKFFKTQEISLSEKQEGINVEELVIETDAVDIEIDTAPTNTSDITATLEGKLMYIGNDEIDAKLTMTRSEQKIAVNVTTTRESHFNFFFINMLKLKISLPQGAAYQVLNAESISGNISLNSSGSSRNVDLYSAAGNINVERFEVTQKLNIESVSGNLNAKTKAADVKLTTTSGNVITDLTSADTLQIKTISGDVRAQFVQADKAQISSTSGNLILTGNCNECNLSTMSGNINAQGNIGAFTFNSTSGNLFLKSGIARSGSLRTVSGEITIEFPANADFTVNYSLVSGKYRDYYGGGTKEGNSYRYGSGDAIVSVTSTSGNVTCRK